MYTGPLCPRHGKRARDRKPLGLSEQLTQSHVPEGLGGQSVGRRQATQAGCGLVDTCPVSAPVSRPLTVPSGVSGVTAETRAGPGSPPGLAQIPSCRQSQCRRGSWKADGSGGRTWLPGVSSRGAAMALGTRGSGPASRDGRWPLHEAQGLPRPRPCTDRPPATQGVHPGDPLSGERPRHRPAPTVVPSPRETMDASLRHAYGKGRRRRLSPSGGPGRGREGAGPAGRKPRRLGPCGGRLPRV